MRQAVINCMPTKSEEVLRWLKEVEDNSVDYRALADSGEFFSTGRSLKWKYLEEIHLRPPCLHDHVQVNRCTT